MTVTRKAIRAPTVADPHGVALDLEVQRAVVDEALPDDAAFARWVRAALAGRRSTAELAIRIVAADEGRALNSTWRGRDAPTNVLSFAAELPPGVDLPLLGDLVLCAPVVRAEAAAQDKALDDHYAHLTVHGVLHLLGLDHEEDAAALAMEAEERRILAELGIDDPYRDTER